MYEGMVYMYKLIICEVGGVGLGALLYEKYIHL